MDSTLVQAEVIDELAKVAGVGDEVAAITAAAMRGVQGTRLIGAYKMPSRAFQDTSPRADR